MSKEIRNRIIELVNLDMNKEDVASWKCTSDGKFLVMYAYQCVLGLDEHKRSSEWHLVWKWVGP